MKRVPLCDKIETESQSQQTHLPPRAPSRLHHATYAFLLCSLAPLPAPAQEAPPSNAELARRIEALAQELEDARHGEVTAPPASQYGFGPAASKVYRIQGGVSLAGYGEMVYNNFADENQDGDPSGKNDQIDYLRQILYVGYKFDDRVLFNAEIEFEHASGGKEGEVSVEFGYLDILMNAAVNVRAGLVLLPIGFVNELHEPPVFYGVLRPEVERHIIPTTWRANGAGVFGEPLATPGLSYRAYVVESLKSVGSDENFGPSGLRDGRQEGSEADAEDLAGVARVDFTRRGVLVGGSVFFGNTGQGAKDSAGNEIDGLTRIYEAHLEVQHRGVRFRGLVSRADVDEADVINTANGVESLFANPASTNANEGVGSVLQGWYLEAGYDVLSLLRPASRFKLIPYVRYEQLDTHHEVPAGYVADAARDRDVLTVGGAFYPHPQVAFKADWVHNSNDADTGIDQWNLGMGFFF